MTKLLEKAFKAAAQLSEKDQDIIASLIIDELADESKWIKSFNSSEEQLSKLASEARAEYHSGKTKPLDI